MFDLFGIRKRRLAKEQRRREALEVYKSQYRRMNSDERKAHGNELTYRSCSSFFRNETLVLLLQAAAEVEKEEELATVVGRS